MQPPMTDNGYRGRSRMFRFIRFIPFALVSCALLAAEDDAHPTLAIGSPAPGFSLPGIDGKAHE
jgi:hypothetical protein